MTQAILQLPNGLLTRFRGAGAGLLAAEADEKIVGAVLDYFRGQGELTVLDPAGLNELFRVGRGYPQHNVSGVHIHPPFVEFKTGLLKADKDAFGFAAHPQRAEYLERLFAALERGSYRLGFKKRA